MTALDKYVRLESDALWRATPDGQRRDVSVSFGDATLVISDGAGRPLTHWSLPALIRQNPDDMPAIYTPDEDGSEILEIADGTMVDAIEEVRKALARTRPRPGKLRHWLTAGIITVSLLLGVFWLPGALMQQTLAVVPAAKRAAFAETMLMQIEVDAGTACRAPQGAAAAAGLMERVFGPANAPQMFVVPTLGAGAVALPGHVYVLDAGVLQASDDPAVAAGFLLAAQAAVPDGDPLQPLLTEVGLGTTFRLLTTGEIPAPILQTHARDLLAKPPASDMAALQSAFDAAQIPTGPYAAAIDRKTGSMPDLGPDAFEGQDIPLILDDSDWVSLQNICNS